MAMTEAQRKANQKWDKFNEAMNTFVEAHGGWYYWMNETKSEETEE